MVPWNGPRAKVQIKLSIQRLRTLQEKKLALAKSSRREIADLLNKNRIETARLRVESLVQDDIYVELLEILELYAETLQARFGLLDASTGEEPEPSIADAVCAIVYAAPRTELKELQVLRELLMHKFGRNFSLSLTTTPPPPSVPSRITSKLKVFVPSKELVDAYLSEIARGYGVDWAPEPAPDEEEAEEGIEPLKRDTKEDDSDYDQGSEGGGNEDERGGDKLDNPISGDEKVEKGLDVKKQSKAKSKSTSPEKKDASPIPPPAAAAAPKKLSPEEELAQRFERLKNLR
ncbi:uncharacterized protein I303_108190 [Kwoniella dejecticola CBS 10117]|uniref:DUF292-domain-containing protein n=1 Tax=Kwoniella dejecticola CBS 10117 TaxID=1296121 RepID=A0A1A5ZY29_9TREE|nr:uncharacterized protein I303_07484 [Kwoniella dejecticola CBS 10117]OBR82717.1 hypothetical protein I303_07484 [Kwoniella dejecticola CBS 10117]